jgi:hypothetical protein
LVGITPSTELLNDGSGRLISRILPYGIKLNIDRRKIDVTVTGSILANFADVIAELFSGKIADAVEVLVEDILIKSIPKILNKRWDGIWTPLKKDDLFNSTAIDTTIPFEWQVTKERINVFMRGLWYVMDNVQEPNP